MTLRVMLDTNIYDKVGDTCGMVLDLRGLAKQGELEIITTHIQEDELNRICDPPRRKMVLQVPTKRVSTSGGVWGVSKLGSAKWGKGESGDLRYHDIQKGNKKHIEDALIALTAEAEADVFVTEDKQLGTKVKKTAMNLKVWNFAAFAKHVRSLLKGKKTAPDSVESPEGSSEG